jgi:hypothetical protein
VGWDRFFRRGEREPKDDESTGPAAAGDGADEAAARALDLSYSLGQARPDEQRIAAIERLTELRAAGKVSEENFLKEKRRLSGKG